MLRAGGSGGGWQSLVRGEREGAGWGGVEGGVILPDVGVAVCFVGGHHVAPVAAAGLGRGEGHHGPQLEVEGPNAEAAGLGQELALIETKIR